MNKPLNLLFALLLSIVTLAQNKTLGKQDLQKPGRGHRKAILIGNNNYSTQPSLKNCERDVDSMAVALGTLGFQVYPYKNLNRENMIKALRDFYETLQPEDTCVVFFSLHGAGVIDESFFAPIDINFCDIVNEQLYGELRLSRIINQIQERNVKTSLFFLDACRENLDIKLKGCSPNAQLSRGTIAPIYTPFGYLIGFATSEADSANDDSFDKHNSLFTSELLKHLRKPNVGIREILDSVRSGVEQRSKYKQIPKRVDDLKKDIVLRISFPKIEPTQIDRCEAFVLSRSPSKIRVVREGTGFNGNDAITNAMENAMGAMPDLIQTVFQKSSLRYSNRNLSEVIGSKKLKMNTIGETVEQTFSRVMVKKPTIVCQGQAHFSQADSLFHVWMAVEIDWKNVVLDFEHKLSPEAKKVLDFNSKRFNQVFSKEWERIQNQIVEL